MATSHRIATPFGPQTTAMDVVAGVDLTGRRAIVTGGASGIGVETARALARAGAAVTLAVRNTAAASPVAAGIKRTTNNDAVEVSRLELSDLQSVRDFVARWRGPLDVLVNNAGVMAIPERRLSAQGHEMHFATNHLGHFALALGLHDALAAGRNARIVSVSSVAHLNSDVDLDDVDFEHRPYAPWVAYGQSKTANILFAVEAASRWAIDGIVANALNPGRIASTNLRPSLKDAPVPLVQAPKAAPLKDIQQAAATSTLLAASPLVAGVTGRYFEDCQEAEPTRPGLGQGVARYALDAEHARALWETSLRLVS